MGRRKFEIKRIEDPIKRRATYSKRRQGLLKKAREINVLCDAKVSVVIVNGSNKMFEFCSPNTTLATQVQSYQDISRTKLWDAKHEDLSKEIERINNANRSMQIRLRHLNGEDFTSLRLPELLSLEDTLETGLERVKSRKMEVFDEIVQHNRDLEDDNKRLWYLVRNYECETADAPSPVQPNQPDQSETT